MLKLKNPFQGIKVEYTRSHPLTKVVVIGLILVSMAAMIALMWSGTQLKREIEALRKEAAQLEAENADLRDQLDKQDSVEGVEHIAENELDLVDPDIIIIDPNP
jgi:cell division protein FtsB